MLETSSFVFPDFSHLTEVKEEIYRNQSKARPYLEMNKSERHLVINLQYFNLLNYENRKFTHSYFRYS